MPIHTLLIMLLLLLLSPYGKASAGLHDTQGTYEPVPEYLEDASGRFLFDDLPEGDFRAVPQMPPQFGYSESVFWLRFNVSANEAVRYQWLKIDYPMLDYLSIYFQDENGLLIGEHQTGDRRRFHDRAVPDPAFVVELPETSESYTVLVRVQSESSLELPISLLSDKQLRISMGSGAWFQGLFFGAVIMLGLYHALIFTASGERVYLYFGGLSAAMALIQATLWGRAYQFLWPESPDWNHVAITLLVNFSNLFGVLYVGRVVKLYESYPRVAMGMVALAIISAVMVLLSLVIPYKDLIQPTLILSLIIFVVAGGIVIQRMRDRYPPAFAVFIAACMYILGSAAYIFGKLGILPNSVLLDNALAIGLLLQVMLFAYALSVRMAMDRDLRERAQKESAIAKDLLLDSERQQNVRLDQEVRMRTKELQEANARLEKISTTDGLTGLYNRRHFDECLEHEYTRAARGKQNLSVIMLDIDHFKKLNDTYGHAFGDEALRQTALRIQDVLKRPADIAFRYGGEEFVILLPDTPSSAANILARQIWSAMRSEAIDHQDQTVTLTVSIGIATSIAWPNGDPYELLHRADEQLYRAKEEGRDRICLV